VPWGWMADYESPGKFGQWRETGFADSLPIINS